MNIKRNILLNPGPATTTDTVKLAQVVPDICPREKEFISLMDQFRKDLLKVVHAKKEKDTAVLFCGSGTLCMDACLNSLLPAGAEILVINNGVYSSRAVEICKYYDLPHIDLRFPVDELPDLHVIQEVLEKNPKIALVYTTHHETGTGILNPVREIGALAHRHHAVFTVDTTSTLAMRPIHMEADNIDFCMASAQKGLAAVTGLSFVIGKKELIERSKTYPYRSYYCNLYRQYHHFQTCGEMHFTPPVQAVYAAVQGLREYFEEGELPRWRRCERICGALRRGLRRLGFREAIREELQSGLVVSVLYPDDPAWNFDQIHDYCYERGFTIYPGKMERRNTFRLCALGAIDETDIENFFTVFERGLREQGLSLPVLYREKQEAGTP